MKTIYVDCDETLVFWYPEEADVVSSDGHPLAINSVLVHNLILRIKAGDKVIVWSQGGEDWAKEVADLVGLSKYPEVRCLSKPNIMIDDLGVLQWMPNRTDPKQSYLLNVSKEQE